MKLPRVPPLWVKLFNASLIPNSGAELWQTRVAQMAKKCRTYWDQCFSHLFYLVILENGQKVQKKCCLRVPNFKSRNGLIYIVISGQKWLFLHQLCFGPLNGSENTNKPLETNGHMPIPYPGPKSPNFEQFRGGLGIWLNVRDGGEIEYWKTYWTAQIWCYLGPG